MDQYEIADHIAVELARVYSRESKEPYFVAVGNHSGYDLVSGSGSVRIELKTDVVASRSGNAAVEFWDGDRPSGILGTTANLWVHLIPSDEEEILIAYEFLVPSLLKLCLESGRVQKAAGGTTLLKLIPLRLFKLAARRSFRMRTEFFDEITAKAGNHAEAPSAG